MRTIRITMAQINPIVGDLTGNRDKIIDAISGAKKHGADIVALPELAVTGYPPEDLILKPRFVKDNIETLKEIRRATKGLVAIVGFVDSNHKRLFNAAAVLADGKHIYTYHKVFLPNYGVFDEYRYFKPGGRYPVFMVKGVGVGVNICEDIWYEEGPARVQALAGAEVIVNINASPYHKGKGKERQNMLSRRAKENDVIISYTNTVGGQDELVFDGQSMAVDRNGKVLVRGKQFEEELLTVDIQVPGTTIPFPEDREQFSDFMDYVSLSGKAAGKKKSLPARRSGKPPCRARGSVPRPRARRRRLYAQERLQGRGYRTFRRHRFVARGCRCRGCDGKRERDGCIHAVAVQLAGEPRGRL